MPLEVQPVLPIESPALPIGELLPPVGWRGESVHPFGVDERLGRGDPNITPANLKQEYERQQQNQAEELGEEDQANLAVVMAVLAADERYGTSVSEATYANLALQPMTTLLNATMLRVNWH